MEKVAFLSDTHELSPLSESRSLFPGYFEQLSPLQREIEYVAQRALLADLHDAALEHAWRWGGGEPLALLGHLGDITSGWQEQGVYHESLLPRLQEVVDRYRGMAYAALLAAGNHETGYAEVEGKLSHLSVRVCENYNLLWNSAEVGELLFISICSPLCELEVEAEWELTLLQEQQEEYVERMLKHALGHKFVLLTHHPAVGRLGKVLEPHLSRLERCLYGDLHNPAFERVMRMQAWVLPGWRAALYQKGTLCPSVAPLWWPGCEMLLGEVSGSTLTLRRERIPLSSELKVAAQSSPFGSFTGALWSAAKFSKRWQ